MRRRWVSLVTYLSKKGIPPEEYRARVAIPSTPTNTGKRVEGVPRASQASLSWEAFTQLGSRGRPAHSESCCQAPCVMWTCRGQLHA